MTTQAPERPFGLTRATAIAPDKAVDVLAGLHYDPALQVNVNEEGVPAVDLPGVMAVTHQDTRYDSQWFTDKDRVDPKGR